MIVTLVIL